MDSIPLFSQLQTQQNAAFGIPAMFTFDDRSLRAVSVNAAFQDVSVENFPSGLISLSELRPDRHYVFSLHPVQGTDRCGIAVSDPDGGKQTAYIEDMDNITAQEAIAFKNTHKFDKWGYLF